MPNLPKSILGALLVAVLWAAAAVPAQAEPVPRRVIAFHHPLDETLKRHNLHRLAEMPLNWLGLKMEYRELDDPLPEDAIDDPTVAGVVTWFEQPGMENPEAYIRWADRMIDAGKKFVVFGDLGFLTDENGKPTDPALVDSFARRLGFRLHGDWTDVTFDTQIVQRDPDFYDYERRMGGQLPPYEVYEPVSKDTQVKLRVRSGQSGAESAIYMISPAGAFVEGGWVFYKDPVLFKTKWYVNPFRLFATVFDTDDRPKPDVTTQSGRRMYFSHIDGDGWRNVTLVREYRGTETYSARVIMEKAIMPHPDLPITVGPIAADLDPEWSGDEKADEVARQIFRLPQVEMAHHTYSHPFDWGFFEDYTPEKEAPFVKDYPNPDIAVWGADVVKTANNAQRSLKEVYDQPRAFGHVPFDLDLEFEGAAKEVDKYAPRGKKVEVVLWSGDTSPTPRMIRAAREAGLLNLNGGDARFDPEYPSVGYVPPVGFEAGSEQQIYAAASNENTYTDLWSARYFGFRDLIYTLKNTETPRRLKPINVYYHMYTGERDASLNALLGNLAYADSQSISPVTAVQYVRIAQGFYSTRFERLGPWRWRVLDRGALQTIRFDHAEGRTVDMVRSRGVLGFDRHLGSLYVALDADVAEPEIALVEGKDGVGKTSWLMDSRWRIRGLERKDDELAFTGSGFGAAEMRWGGMKPGRWRAVAKQADGETVSAEAEAGPDGVLEITVPLMVYDPVRFTLTRLGGA